MKEGYRPIDCIRGKILERQSLFWRRVSGSSESKFYSFGWIWGLCMKEIRYAGWKLPVFDKLSGEFDFIYDNIAPDYYIVAATIYYDELEYLSFRRFLSQDVISIFYAGESISPDWNIFDYAGGYDRYLENGDRYCRLPFHFLFEESLSLLEQTRLRRRVGLEMDKEKFCNFIYSNALGSVERKRLFYKISEYRHVDSLGGYLNNCHSEHKRNEENWYKSSVEMKLPYKFSIAAENACFSGYSSEKILSSFAADTVPIYWGDPDISLDYNPSSFIDCHEYRSFDEVLNRVKMIDADIECWESIIREPVFLPWQIEKVKKEKDDCIEFFRHIFDQSKNEAKRRGYGYYPMLYNKMFTDGLDRVYESKRGKTMQAREKIAEVLAHYISFHLSGDKEIIIWGIGNNGKLCIDALRTENINIAYIVDKNSSLDKYEGIDVNRPEYLRDDSDRSSYHVIVSMYDKEAVDEVRRMLYQWQIYKDNVIIFPNIRELCMREVWKQLRIMSTEYELVRIGGSNDGGYVMADVFDGRVAYSFGIGKDYTWDESMAERGYQVFMYDYSVDKITSLNQHLHFKAMGIGCEKIGKLDTLQAFIEENGHEQEQDMILKMDIEGGEWDVFDALADSIILKFQQIVLELHGANNLSQFDKVLRVLSKLSSTHNVIHVHANNVQDYENSKEDLPYFLEVTWLLKGENDKVEVAEDVELPLSIDNRNIPEKKEIELGKWNKRFW